MPHVQKTYGSVPEHMTSKSHDRPAIVIAGPTAGGKTALAVAIAHALPGGGECINADSMQVYRGMDIGTAKPSMAERKGIPHHLLDIVDPSEPYTLERWLEAAEHMVGDVRSRGRWPIVVGGTSLYLQTFYYGMLEGPGPNPDLRRELDALDERQLRTRLEVQDPEAAERLHPNDRRRTIRALEVAASGTPLSALQGQWSGPHRTDAVLIGLDWPVEDINRRINARVRAMAANGLLDEVRAVAPTLGLQAREALGYKQLLPVLNDNTALDDALEQVKIRTRRFAKQQRTWLRRFRQLQPALWLKKVEIQSQDAATEAVAWVLEQVCEDKKLGNGP